MHGFLLDIVVFKDELSLKFKGKLDIYTIAECEKKLEQFDFGNFSKVNIELFDVEIFDTAFAVFIYNLEQKLISLGVSLDTICKNQEINTALKLVKKQKSYPFLFPHAKNLNFIENIGKKAHANYLGFIAFVAFVGKLFATKMVYLKNIKNIRYKEIAFEINENALKALGIISLTSFLIGLVIAYQSAFQLKIYGANIFIVDMLGISILRELAPLITAIVIAGRSGSAFTAQIGAMKITQELDAMQTMGFDPYAFLVLPKIIALMICMPVLIFVSDIMGILGGMVVANLDLNITVNLFLDRFAEVIAVKHFFVGIFKGPFFAFLIASIGIYRGMMVKDDTQSIGFNTTKSVVESIFAVIVCDAVFSIAFTNLGI